MKTRLVRGLRPPTFRSDRALLVFLMHLTLLALTLPVRAQQTQSYVRYTAPDGSTMNLLARADTDGDGIENELEIEGYTFDVQSGALLPCEGSLTECFFTDPLQASTDKDPYSDFMEATGANMDQSVETPYNHPLVAAQPTIVLRLLSYDVIPIAEITDTEGHSRSQEFSTSVTNETKVGGSLSVTASGETGFSLTEGFSASSGASVTEETFHSQTHATTTGTSQGVEINWSTARTTRTNEAAELRLHVDIENQGYAPAWSIVPSFNLKLGNKVIATVTPDVPDLNLAPGTASAELVIEQDDLGNGITVSLDELKALQLGAPLTLEVVGVEAQVSWWDPETNAATDRIPWSTFQFDIAAVTTELRAEVGDVPYTFKVYAGSEDTPYTLRELLPLVFAVRERDGATVIEDRRYPDDWYVTTTSADLVEAWEDAGRPSILDVDMVGDTRLHMLSPGSDPGPAIDFASFGPDLKQVFVSASSRGGFPVVSVQVELTIAGEVREVDLVKEAGAAFYTNEDPFETPPESVGVVTVTDARGDVTSEELLFPFATLDTDCAGFLEEIEERPPVNGEYLVLLDGNRPAQVYCWFYDWFGDSVLDPPRTSFWIPRVDSSDSDFGEKAVDFLNDDTGFVVGFDQSLLRTDDGGRTWTLAIEKIGEIEDGTDIFFVDDQVGTIVGSGGEILRTEDGGATWTAQQSGTDDFLKSVYFTDADHGVAVGFASADDPTILRTTDGGATWTEQASGVTDVFLNDVFFTDAETGLAVGSDGTILRTTDGGQTWTALESGTETELSGIFFTDAETGLAVGSDGTILRTTDGGQTWTALESETTENLISVSFADADIGVAVGEGKTILRTTDGGQTWTEQEGGASTTFFDVFLTDANTGVITGLGGLILHTTSGGGTPVVITSIEEEPGDELPDRIHLGQNYPNPFNPTTTIPYTLRRRQHVTLTVYDLLGRRVATLVDGTQPPGAYRVRLDAGLLASGVYVYRLSAGEVSETRKMVLMR